MINLETNSQHNLFAGIDKMAVLKASHFGESREPARRLISNLLVLIALSGYAVKEVLKSFVHLQNSCSKCIMT